MNLKFDNTFTRELPADKENANNSRQVERACYSYVEPEKFTNPQLIHAATPVANLLGIDNREMASSDFLKLVTGQQTYIDTKPYAMCYGGHQFGQWAGQLGDGRAINLGEVVHQNKRWAIQLKGVGATPYSRRADGLAVLRSSVREYLCSEAMYYLGVPTTRALSLSLSGKEVLRDMLYNGNAAYEKGAIVCRVAPNFIRFGNFEIFSARNDIANLQSLTDYTIKHYYPEIKQGTKDTYTTFFSKVCITTMEMIVQWQRVGFVHGVMNTDNMSILGITIDYGPYGWLEGYDRFWTPNTTDAQHKRYRYGNQADIALWNLVKLANALYPLVNDAEPFESALNEAKALHTNKYLSMMKSKLGITTDHDDDAQLIEELEYCLELTETDMTIFFRNLATWQLNRNIISDESNDFFGELHHAFYVPVELTENIINKWRNWLNKYLNRLRLETTLPQDRLLYMNSMNPKYVFRNYMAQLAIDAANNEDYSLITELYELLKNPYDEQPTFQKWFAKRPDWARTKVGCSMLSCSS